VIKQRSLYIIVDCEWSFGWIYREIYEYIHQLFVGLDDAEFFGLQNLDVDTQYDSQYNVPLQKLTRNRDRVKALVEELCTQDSKKIFRARNTSLPQALDTALLS
jgi:hypothetical protein